MLHLLARSPWVYSETLEKLSRNDPRNGAQTNKKRVLKRSYKNIPKSDPKKPPKWEPFGPNSVPRWLQEPSASAPGATKPPLRGSQASKTPPRGLPSCSGALLGPPRPPPGPFQEAPRTAIQGPRPGGMRGAIESAAPDRGAERVK